MAEDANANLTHAEQLSRLYEEAEAEAARATEELVATSGFARLLGRLGENVAAMTKLSGDLMDIALHNLRIAGRRDITNLARQLARTEDELERLLQEVERLRDETARAAAGAPRSRGDGRTGRAPANRRKESS